MRTTRRNLIPVIGMAMVLAVIGVLFRPVPLLAVMPDTVTGLYLPPQLLTERLFTEIDHYYTVSGMNAVVIHVKDPRGRIHWNSNTPLAHDIGAVTGTGSAEQACRYFNERHIWTIAKVDVFQDTQLALSRPEKAVLDAGTGVPWKDNAGLSWTNPYDTEVWNYILSLCQELADIGFDEIQFDYVRFPSDGNLSRIRYPVRQKNVSMAECIGRFFKAAYTTLKPKGVILSADIFGLTAWKSNDFGVGQVLETISPYVDVLCPMFYPSHFPKGFLGLAEPSEHPERLMRLSTKNITLRTTTRVRPWIQGFWYSPQEISLQLDGLSGQPVSGWMVWHSSGNYQATYECLSKRLKRPFPEPVFYPGLEALKKRPRKTVHGSTHIINMTDYAAGISVLSLEPSGYDTPVSVIGTLDEAIMDRLLRQHGRPLGPRTSKSVKSIILADIMCHELGLNPRRIRPMPIYVLWGTSGDFRLTHPSFE